MSRRGWVLFLAMSVIWGVPYLFIKVAVEEVSPATMVFVRTAIATALLLPIALARRQVVAVLRRWPWVLAFALVEICVAWLFLGVAEQRLSSSLAGLLIAGVPIVGALIAWLGPDKERLDRRRLTGLLLGIAGVGALVGFEVGGGDVGAVLAIAVVVVCYAYGPVILSRRLAGLPGFGVIAVSLAMSMVLFVVPFLLTRPTSLPSPEAMASLVVLGVLCTAIAFLLFFRLIAEVGPARSTVITYLNPAVAVLLGVLVLDESFTATTAIGFGLVIAGSVLATAAPRPSVTAERHDDVRCADVPRTVAEP